MVDNTNLAYLSGAIHNKTLDDLTSAKNFPNISLLEAYDSASASLKATAKSLGLPYSNPPAFKDVEELARQIVADPTATIKRFLDEKKITESQHDVLADLIKASNIRPSYEEKAVASTRLLLFERLNLLNARTDIEANDKLPLQMGLTIAAGSKDY